MKDRAVLLSTLALTITVALFVWLTWTRWGTIGIHPALGALVLGAAFVALAVSGLLVVARRRAARIRRRRPPVPPPPQAPEPPPASPSQAEPETTNEAAVEMK